MEYQRRSIPTSSLRWLARGTSALSIAIILLFFVGFRPSQVALREWIGLMFFPFGVILGMLISWKREFAGSLLSLASLAGFYLVYGVVLTGRFPGGWAFLAFSAPALLFLASWFVGRALKGHGNLAAR
jgi:hypothetical protein